MGARMRSMIATIGSAVVRGGRATELRGSRGKAVKSTRVSNDEAGSSRKAEQQQVLERRLEAMRKKGTKVYKATELPSHKQEVTRMPSGFLSLDIALGGGIPLCGVTELFGAESIGKTTLAVQCLVQALKADKERSVVFVDAENHYSWSYMVDTLGVPDAERFIHLKPRTIEEAFDSLDHLLSTGCISLALFDSVATLDTREALETEVSEGGAGTHARYVQRGMRKLYHTLPDMQCGLIIVNQERQKINMTNPRAQTTTTTGGNALKYFAFTRVQLKMTGQFEGGKDVQAKTYKNKTHVPKITAPLKLVDGSGFSTFDAFIQGAVSYGVIERKGPWYYFNGSNLGQGLEKVKEKLANDSDLANQIHSQALAYAQQGKALHEEAHVGISPQIEQDEHEGDIEADAEESSTSLAEAAVLKE